jgi:hypothetical protein
MFWRRNRTPVKASRPVRRPEGGAGENQIGATERPSGDFDADEVIGFRSGWQGYLALGAVGLAGYMLHTYWDAIFS